MTADIVAEIRHAARNSGAQGAYAAAAHVIEQLEAAGNALAKLPLPCDCDGEHICRWCTAVNDWEEACNV